MAVHKLSADLLGKAELQHLTGGGRDHSLALLHHLYIIHRLGNHDALLLHDVLAAYSGQHDRLVHAGLHGLWVGDHHGDVDGHDHGLVVASLLFDLLAVLVTIGVVTIACLGLADRHHLGHTFLLEGDLHSLGHGVLSFGHVGVAAHLVGDGLHTLGTDRPADGLALLLLHDPLDHQVHLHALGLEGGGAHLDLLHLHDQRAVVLRVVIGRSMMIGRSVVEDRSVVDRGVVDRGVVDRSVVDNWLVGHLAVVDGSRRVGGQGAGGHPVAGGGGGHVGHRGHVGHWVGSWGGGWGRLVHTLRHVNLLTMTVGGATDGDLDMAAGEGGDEAGEEGEEKSLQVRS